MRTRVAILSAGLLILAATAAFIFITRPEALFGRVALPSLAEAPGAVSEISLVRGNSRIELRRDDSAGWLLTSLGDAPADGAAVDMLLGSLGQLRLSATAADAPLPDGDSLTLVRVVQDGREATLALGEADAVANTVPVLAGGTDWVGSPAIAPELDPLAWADVAPPPVPADAVMTLRYIRPDGRAVLAERQQGLLVADGADVDQPVRAMLGVLDAPESAEIVLGSSINWFGAATIYATTEDGLGLFMQVQPGEDALHVRYNADPLAGAEGTEGSPTQAEAAAAGYNRLKAIAFRLPSEASTAFAEAAEALLPEAASEGP